MKWSKNIRYIFTFIPIIYLICVFLIPSMEKLRYNFVAWLIFGIYSIYIVFIWAAFGGKRRKCHKKEEDLDVEIKISQEIFLNRGRWFW